MKRNLSRNPLENIFKETQSVITILYILAVGVGMLFNYQKYSEFGINVFDYAGVFEFLVAPFADFQILLFTIISFLLAYLVYRLDIFWSLNHPKSYDIMSFGWKKFWNGKLRTGSYIFLMILYLYLAADYYGKLTRATILEQPDTHLTYQDDSVISGKVIGITSDILFLYQDEKVKAIPMTALVKEFEIR